MKNNRATSKFVVVLNSEKILEYYRDRPLSDQQLLAIEATNKKLDQGIQVSGQWIEHPTDSDKAIFMASQLISSLLAENDARTAISCAFLATQYPNLKQLRAASQQDHISIELINDKEFVEQTPIQFIAKKDLR